LTCGDTFVCAEADRIDGVEQAEPAKQHSSIMGFSKSTKAEALEKRGRVGADLDVDTFLETWDQDGREADQADREVH
jgi:hypothetical protein